MIYATVVFNYLLLEFITSEEGKQSVFLGRHKLYPKEYTYLDNTHKLVEMMYTKLLQMKLKINITYLVAINFILFCVTLFFKKKKIDS